MRCLRNRLSILAHMIFLSPKKFTSFIVDTKNAHNTPCSYIGHHSVGRAGYICIKLWKETHTSWIEMKHSLGLKSDDALACHLLNTTVTVSNRKNSMETNDLNQSHNLVWETRYISKMTMR